MLIRKPVRLSRALACIIDAVLLSGSAFAQTAPQARPVPAAFQSACPDTIRDVDRIACWISEVPEPAPGGQKPSTASLRSSDGTTIIGSK